MATLPNLASLSKEDLIALVATMQAQPARKLSFKVTAQKPDGKGSDGAISVYGLGRFPTTMYASQWERLLAAADDLKAFIAANEKLIARK